MWFVNFYKGKKYFSVEILEQEKKETVSLKILGENTVKSLGHKKYKLVSISFHKCDTIGDIFRKNLLPEFSIPY